MSVTSFIKNIAGSKKEKKPKRARTKKTTSKAVATSGVAVARRIGLTPMLTEKGVLIQAKNNAVFRVTKQATKGQVIQAIQEVYGVTARRVRTLAMQPKNRRRGRILGKTTGWKKAYVQVDDLSKLNLAP